MRVLIVDKTPPLNDADLRTLYLRGYEVVTAGTEAEAIDWIHGSGFDCIVVGVPESGDSDFGDLGEIRQLARACALVLVTATTAAAFAQEAVAEGSIELNSAPVLAKKIGCLPQPTLIVGSDLQPAWIDTIRESGLRISVARTLQFAMNLLVDGWCQIIFLETEIPGLTENGNLAIFHQIHAKHLIILASALSDDSSTIIPSGRPQKLGQFLELFKHVAGNRPNPCGRTEHLGNSR